MPSEIIEILGSQNLILQSALNRIQQALFKNGQPAGISRHEMVNKLEETESFLFQFIRLNRSTIAQITHKETTEGEENGTTEESGLEGTQPIGGHPPLSDSTSGSAG